MKKAMPDTTPDPIEEVSLDDDEFRARFGLGGSIEAMVDRLAKDGIASATRRRYPALV